jgi:signal peptidase I
MTVAHRAPVLAALAVVAATLGACGGGQPSFTVLSCANFPTLQPGDHVTAVEPAGHLGRGDLVVYRSPLNGADAFSRVVGLPGETVGASDGRIRVDGRVLPERYLRRGTTTADFGPVTVPAGSYFVVGDDRTDSADSRAFGPVAASAIVARVTSIQPGPPPATGEQPSDCRA